MLFEKTVLNIYNQQFLVRCDDTGVVHYFTAADFQGLNTLPFSFIGESGQELRGSFYYYGEMSREKLVIFDHGMGAGHLAYMKEIAELAKGGFTVFSYDHTGCMNSEGDNIRGFAQSLSDLDCCIKALRSTDEYKSLQFMVVGHSWGAFSTLNISAIHKDITHIVAMSGFVSVKDMLTQFFPGILKLYVPALYRLEQKNVPVYADYNAIDSLKSSTAKAMIIHSDDDGTVSFKRHFLKMKKALSERADTYFVAVSGKGHNPNFTEAAVKIKDAFFADYKEKMKNGYFTDEDKKREFKESYDFVKMSEQDSMVWKDIISFLNS